MKVLFVTAVDLSGNFGASVATRSFLSALAARDDVELTVLAPEPREPEVIGRGPLSMASWEFLGGKEARSVAWHVRAALRVRAKVRQLVEDRCFDVVVARHALFFVPAALLFPVGRARLVLMIRGNGGFGFSGKLGGWLNEFGRGLRDSVLGRADRILVAFRESISEKSWRRFSGRILVAPNGADVEKFADPGREVARTTIAMNGGPVLSGKVIGFVGSLKGRHRLSELLDASRLLHEREVAHTLLIVGSGPMLSELRGYATSIGIADRTVFTGAVPHDRVGTFVAASDIMYGPVHPDSPSNPIKVYEALATGRPVITSPTEELRFVREERFGVTVPDDADAEGLARAIEQALDDPWESCARARAWIDEHHSWDNVVDLALGGVEP